MRDTFIDAMSTADKAVKINPVDVKRKLRCWKVITDTAFPRVPKVIRNGGTYVNSITESLSCQKSSFTYRTVTFTVVPTVPRCVAFDWWLNSQEPFFSNRLTSMLFW